MRRAASIAWRSPNFRSNTGINDVPRRFLLGFGKPTTKKGHNPGKIEYGADLWQTKLKDIPPAKANLKSANKFKDLASKSRFPSLTDPFPNAPLSSDVANLSDPITTVTELQNGIKVCSEDSYNQVCSIGVLMNAGLRSEPKDLPGVSLMLETLAFKDTENKTRDELSNYLQDIGGAVSTFSDRETISFQVEILRDRLQLAVEILADSLLRMKVTSDDLKEQATAFAAEVEANNGDPKYILQHAMFATAYPNPGLGRTLLTSVKDISKLSLESFERYREEVTCGSNMVFGGASVDHADFVDLIQKNFGSVPKLPPHGHKNQNKPDYQGGLAHIEAPKDAEFAYFAALFEIPGWIHHRESIVVAVLHKMLGGGSSFSSGGPGKGMHSRLYRRVLNGYWWAEEAEGVALALSDTGLFGIQAACKQSAKYYSECIQVVCQQIIDLLVESSTQPDLFEADLMRAKNQLKTSMFMNLEHRAILYDDIVRQVSIYGFRYGPAELSAMIDEVTCSDVAVRYSSDSKRVFTELKRVLNQILSTNPTIVAVAPKRELKKMASFQNIQEYFKSALEGVKASVGSKGL